MIKEDYKEVIDNKGPSHFFSHLFWELQNFSYQCGSGSLTWFYISLVLRHYCLAAAQKNNKRQAVRVQHVPQRHIGKVECRFAFSLLYASLHFPLSCLQHGSLPLTFTVLHSALRRAGDGYQPACIPERKTQARMIHVFDKRVRVTAGGVSSLASRSLR